MIDALPEGSAEEFNREPFLALRDVFRRVLKMVDRTMGIRTPCHAKMAWLSTSRVMGTINLHCRYRLSCNECCMQEVYLADPGLTFRRIKGLIILVIRTMSQSFDGHSVSPGLPGWQN